MTLNPLAFPKGVKLVCELCQKPALIQCTKCRVTYYCSVEHQRADWQGIHEQICSDIMILRQPLSFLPSEEERQQKANEIMLQKKQLITLTRTTGQKLLFQGKHEQAVPAAMQSLRFAIDVYGIASVELVPSYLILGEASIGLGRLSQAEDYLAQADWTVLKTHETPNAIKSRLNRNQGLLNAAKGDFLQALRYLADDIYHASEEYGPDDIHVSSGYFHMANIFLHQGKLDIADSLYRQVSDAWHFHLDKIVKARTQTPDSPLGIGPGAVDTQFVEEETLDEAQKAEAIQVLNTIHDIRRNRMTSRPHENENEKNESRPHDFVRTCYTLALLYFVLNDAEKAKDFGKSALAACQEDCDDSSRQVLEFMKACQ